MAKKSQPKKLRENPSGSRAVSWFVALMRGLFQPGRLIVLAAAVVAVLILRTAAGWLPDLSGRAEYLVDAAAVEVNPPPHFIPDDFVAQAFRKADLPEHISLLDESATRQIHEALTRHPWVERVRSVSKYPPARVVADLEYRSPVAMVEVPRGVYPIDKHGTLLPPEDFTVADARKYPLVTGVRSTPQGPQGSSWGDPAVGGAAKLATALIEVWKEFQLDKIHCGQDRIDGMPTYLLISQGGSRIMWGYAPGETRPGEPDVRQKLQRLKKYLKHFGDFEKPDGPYEINIRHWQEISRRPITAGLEKSDSL